MELTRYTLSYRLLTYMAIITSMAAVARVGGDASLLAISAAGLTAGHVYMWRTRYASSRVRTAILLSLLFVLLFFLGRDMLYSWTNDPLLLARYLVYGQIVTSFDLSTRRNVMGTLVLAGIVFMLLGQMAFDVWYPLLAGVFILLSFGAGITGHIEEETRRAEDVVGAVWPSAVRVWASLALVSIPLAVVIFLFMPRIGFGAVSQATWLPSRIDLTRGGPRNLPSRPSADVSSNFLASRQSRGSGSDFYVPLGYAGSAADSPVMHVRSRVVTYWRGSTLDEYDGLGWLPSGERVSLLEAAPGEYVFSESDRNPPGRSWYAQSYYLLVEQPHAVFTGYNPGRIYIPQYKLVRLGPGTTYRAISEIPRLDPQQLRRDLADVSEPEHLRLPPISDRTAALAESIVEGAATDYDKAARLEEFLLANYRYDLGVDPLAPGNDAVDTFLFKSQAGYCAQFATTMAVMARHVGLPARVGVGYLPGRFSPMTGAFTVRAGDAHAWVEIRFRANGWVVFDPTPRPELATGAGLNAGWVSFALLDYVGVNFSGALSSLTGGMNLRNLSIPGWAWPAMLGGAALVAGLMVARRWVRPAGTAVRYTALEGQSRREVVATYRRMNALLARKGLTPRGAAQTPRDYAAAVAPRLAHGMDAVGWLTEVTDRAAYDSRPFNPSLVEEAKSRLFTLRRSLVIRDVG